MKTRKQAKKGVRKALAVLLLAVLLLAAMPFGVTTVKAASDTSQVMIDLQKDKDFNPLDYPEKDKDFSVQVIQIAEGVAGSLFVYTYQPCEPKKHLTVTEINMSLSESVDDTALYGLTLVNSDGVFGKYKVNDFKVFSATVRYYNISSVYRLWNKDIDSETGNDNIKNSVAYAVGKVYMAKTENGEVQYFCEKRDVITVVQPFVGFFRYSDGYDWGFGGGTWKYSDMHFIAFDTDFPIDSLQEADISYKTQSYKYINGGSYTFGTEITQTAVTVNGTEKGENVAGGWFSKKYEWKRIQKTSDFINSNNIKDEVKQEISKTKWVLCFYETEVRRDVGGGMGHYTDYGTKVSEITVLRLQFITLGKVYNLGSVSDKVTGDDIPDNEKGCADDFWGWLLGKIVNLLKSAPWWAWLIIVIVVLAIVLPILGFVFPVVGRVLLGILKVIWWIITAPFRFIFWLIKKLCGK